MIFYIIKAPNGEALDWAGTQAEARQLTKEASGMLQRGELAMWSEYEVPTDKPTLLAFLKENCVGKVIAAVTKK